MTKPGDLQTKKTIHELVKEFPDKSYRELEKWRQKNYNKDADQLKLIKEEIQKRKQAELKPIQREIHWREKYNKEQARSDYLQNELDRVKRENNDLHNKVAALLDAVDPAVTIQKARESGL